MGPSLTLYRRDAVLRVPIVAPRNPPVGTRGAVTMLSPQSRRRLAFVAQNSPADWRSMFTMTFPPEAAPRSGKEAKRVLNRYLTGLRRRLPGAYLWFMEFTERGLAHFHMLHTATPPDPIREIRRGSWQNIAATRAECEKWSDAAKAKGEARRKMDRVSVSWEILRSEDGGRRYATKYAFKARQKTIPPGFWDVGRWWGTSRSVAPRPILCLSLNEALSEGKIRPEDLSGYERYGVQYLHALQFDLTRKLLGPE